MFFAAQRFQRFRYGRVGVSCQKDLLRLSGAKGFPQLFCPHNDLMPGQFGKACGLHRFFIILSVHTVYYYTLFSKKVNKN